MFHKGFFVNIPTEKIKQKMQKEGFSPLVIKDKPGFIYKQHQHAEKNTLSVLKAQ